MSQTADRYAKALFELSQEQKCLEDVQQSLTQIQKLMTDSNDLRQFITNPLLAYEESIAVLKAMFEGKIPDLCYKFLVFITQKGRLNILSDIIESFDHLYLSSTNVMRARVKTAMPLNDQDKTFINQRLQDKFHHQMLIQWDVDTSIIGGFRIFAQDKLYDYSFKSQLDHFLQNVK